MAVTEALMSLFLKELVATEKVLEVVRRLEKSFNLTETNSASPTDQEEALLIWVNKCCQVVKKKAEGELEVI